MRLVTLVVAVLPVLWSCENSAPHSQIAAKVNGSEIALEQLRHAVAAGTAAPGAAKPTPAQVMETMIDEELLAQKALKLKLERRPQVRAMIETYLIGKWRDGALVGTTPREAFFVRCGLGQTMTALDIVEGRLNVEIGMAAVRPAEFVVFRVSHKLQTS